MDFSNRHFAVSFSLSPELGQLRCPRAGALIAPSSELAVHSITSASQRRCGHSRAIVDWNQFSGVFGPIGMMQIARSMCTDASSLFFQFVACESLDGQFIPSDATEFMDHVGAQSSLRVNHAFFGDAADLVTQLSPSLVSLDFTGFAGDLTACPELHDILEAAGSCGAWVSIPSTLDVDQKGWLRERGASLLEHHALEASFIKHNPTAVSHHRLAQEATSVF